MTISVSASRVTTLSMWRASWPADLRPPLRRFLKCLSRFLRYGGRFTWTGIGNVIEQFGHDNGRRYTSRWVERLLAEASALGLIRRVWHSAPGRPAVYEAVIPGHPGYRTTAVRPRGIRPRRLLAAFRRETGPRVHGDYVQQGSAVQGRAQDDHGDPQAGCEAVRDGGCLVPAQEGGGVPVPAVF